MENYGSGPGELTSDGCAVEFYARLALGDEADIVHAAVPAGASVLELGCGVGRILRGLEALGHPVVGVDESAGMLARAEGLSTVRSRIETLRLERRFDVVLLASTMINAPEAGEFLATARYHLRDGGALVVQRHAPGWFETVEPYSRERNGVLYTLSDIVRDGPLLTATIEYRIGDQEWSHRFTTRRLDDDETAAALAQAGFGAPVYLTEDRRWLIS